MQQRLGLTVVAVLAAVLVHFAGAVMAQPGGRPEVKQIQLTEKQVQGVVAAQKDISAVLEKIQGPPPDELPPPILAELDAAAKKHGFKDFNDYDEVLGNITMVMTGIDPKTKVFTEPAAAIKQEIADVTANKTIPAGEKKQMLEELNEALKSAQPIQFPGNIELVKKYYDKIDAREPYDRSAYEACLKESIETVVRQQAEAGINIVSDGEFSKGRNWAFYFHDRLSGLATRPLTPDEDKDPMAAVGGGQDRVAFPEFYAEYDRISGLSKRLGSRFVVNGALTYSDAQVKRDIANLKA